MASNTLVFNVDANIASATRKLEQLQKEFDKIKKARKGIEKELTENSLKSTKKRLDIVHQEAQETADAWSHNGKLMSQALRTAHDQYVQIANLQKVIRKSDYDAWQNLRRFNRLDKGGFSEFYEQLETLEKPRKWQYRRKAISEGIETDFKKEFKRYSAVLDYFNDWTRKSNELKNAMRKNNEQIKALEHFKSQTTDSVEIASHNLGIIGLKRANQKLLEEFKANKALLNTDEILKEGLWVRSKTYRLENRRQLNEKTGQIKVRQVYSLQEGALEKLAYRSARYEIGLRNINKNRKEELKTLERTTRQQEILNNKQLKFSNALARNIAKTRERIYYPQMGMLETLGGLGAGYASAYLTRGMIDRVAHYQKIQSQANTWSLSPLQKSQFDLIADRTMNQNTMMSRTEAIDATLAGMTSLGHFDYDKLKKIVPIVSKYAQASKSLGYSNDTVANIIKNYLGVAEARQQTTNTEAMLGTFKTLWQIENVTGGKVTVKDFETILRNLGPGASLVSDEGLLRMVAFAEQIKVAGHGGGGGAGAGISTVGNLVKMLQLMASGKPSSLGAKQMLAQLDMGDGTSPMDYTPGEPGGVKLTNEMTEMIGIVKRKFQIIKPDNGLAKSGFTFKNEVWEDPVKAISQLREPIIEFTKRVENLETFYGKGKKLEDIGVMDEQKALSSFIAKTGLSQRVVAALTTFMNPFFQARSAHTLESAKGQKSVEEVMTHEKAVGNWNVAVVEMDASLQRLAESFAPVIAEFAKLTSGFASFIKTVAEFNEKHPLLTTMLSLQGILVATIPAISMVIGGLTRMAGSYKMLKVHSRDLAIYEGMQRALANGTNSFTLPVKSQKVQINFDPKKPFQDQVTEINKSLNMVENSATGCVGRMVGTFGKGLGKITNLFFRAIPLIGTALMALDIGSIVGGWLMSIEMGGKSVVDRIKEYAIKSNNEVILAFEETQKIKKAVEIKESLDTINDIGKDLGGEGNEGLFDLAKNQNPNETEEERANRKRLLKEGFGKNANKWYRDFLEEPEEGVKSKTRIAYERALQIKKADKNNVYGLKDVEIPEDPRKVTPEILANLYLAIGKSSNQLAQNFSETGVRTANGMVIYDRSPELKQKVKQSGELVDLHSASSAKLKTEKTLSFGKPTDTYYQDNLNAFDLLNIASSSTNISEKKRNEYKDQALKLINEESETERLKEIDFFKKVVDEKVIDKETGKFNPNKKKDGSWDIEDEVSKKVGTFIETQIEDVRNYLHDLGQSGMANDNETIRDIIIKWMESDKSLSLKGFASKYTFDDTQTAPDPNKQGQRVARNTSAGVRAGVAQQDEGYVTYYLAADGKLYRNKEEEIAKARASMASYTAGQGKYGKDWGVHEFTRLWTQGKIALDPKNPETMAYLKDPNNGVHPDNINWEAQNSEGKYASDFVNRIIEEKDVKEAQKAVFSFVDTSKEFDKAIEKSAEAIKNGFVVELPKSIQSIINQIDIALANISEDNWKEKGAVAGAGGEALLKSVENWSQDILAKDKEATLELERQTGLIDIATYNERKKAIELEKNVKLQEKMNETIEKGINLKMVALEADFHQQKFSYAEYIKKKQELEDLKKSLMEGVAKAGTVRANQIGNGLGGKSTGNSKKAYEKAVSSFKQEIESQKAKLDELNFVKANDGTGKLPTTLTSVERKVAQLSQKNGIKSPKQKAETEKLGNELLSLGVKNTVAERDIANEKKAEELYKSKWSGSTAEQNKKQYEYDVASSNITEARLRNDAIKSYDDRLKYLKKGSKEEIALSEEKQAVLASIEKNGKTERDLLLEEYNEKNKTAGQKLVDEWQNISSIMDSLQSEMMTGFIDMTEKMLDGNLDSWRDYANNLIVLVRRQILQAGFAPLLNQITGGINKGITTILFGSQNTETQRQTEGAEQAQNIEGQAMGGIVGGFLNLFRKTSPVKKGSGESVPAPEPEKPTVAVVDANTPTDATGKSMFDWDGLWDDTKNFFSDIGTSICNFGKGIDEFLGGPFSKLGSAFSSMFTTVGNWIAGLFKSGDVGGGGKAGGLLGIGIQSIVAGISGMVGGPAGAAIGAIGNAGMTVFNNVNGVGFSTVDTSNALQPFKNSAVMNGAYDNIGAGGGFGLKGSAMALGGIMTSNGEINLAKYAGGGIANSPQIALFGEGSMPEAYVPLPDGRSIPVTINGGQGFSDSVGGNQFNININTVVNNDGSSDSSSDKSNDTEGESVKKFGNRLKVIVRQEIAEQCRPGGLLHKES